MCPEKEMKTKVNANCSRAQSGRSETGESHEPDVCQAECAAPRLFPTLDELDERVESSAAFGCEGVSLSQHFRLDVRLRLCLVFQPRSLIAPGQVASVASRP
ncbi:hypothetical protein F2P81_025452 [Scophthalmus maximus]|uniref:Uncharacterized protein n=1 Tax=Scophthalmus maximus TaxID=52904 RepID=A0A6A4RUU6_SCOMX|nr:hypothetical protein F2P81_025452 [Scophthalmus maximus]